MSYILSGLFLVVRVLVVRVLAVCVSLLVSGLASAHCVGSVCPHPGERINEGKYLSPPGRMPDDLLTYLLVQADPVGLQGRGVRCLLMMAKGDAEMMPRQRSKCGSHGADATGKGFAALTVTTTQAPCCQTVQGSTVTQPMLCSGPRMIGGAQAIDLDCVARCQQQYNHAGQHPQYQCKWEAALGLRGDELIEAGLVAQHVSQQLLQAVLGVYRHVYQGARGCRIDDGPADAFQVDLWPGVTIDGLDQQRRTASAIAGRD